MKRDVDLVRSLLLQIEEKDIGNGQELEIAMDGVASNIIVEHLFLCWQSDLIDARDASSQDGRAILVLRLTMAGHDFLDSIRDPIIWQKTKDGAKAAGGFSLELLGDLAKGFIKTQIKKATGIEV